VSGEAKQDKVRELALKSIFRARAKGSCVGDCCATIAALRMSTALLPHTHTSANAPTQIGENVGEWLMVCGKCTKKKTPSHAHNQHA
jgi:hypothetical protein